MLALFAGILAFGSQWNSRLQSAWFDAYQVVLPRHIETMPATIIEIDQRSLASIGQWPWPRSVLARMIEVINSHAPAAIGVDLLMPEPDGYSPERLLARVQSDDPALASRIAALPTNDAELARVLAAVPTVLAIAGADQPTGALLRATPFVVSDSAGRPVTSVPEVVHYDAVLTSIDELDRAASGRGLITVTSSAGVIRRIPLVSSIDGTLVPTLAIEMLRVAFGARALRFVTDGDTAKGVEVGELFAPTEGDGAVRVYYSPHNTDRFISAVDLLNGKFDPAQIESKLVLIGVTGVGLIEDKNTPLGVTMPGVEIHAQLLENLYDRTLLVRPAWGRIVEALAFLVLGTIVIAMTPRWKPRDSALLVVGSSAALLAGGYLAFRMHRVLLDVATPTLGLTLLFGLLLMLTLSEATRQRKSLERLVQAQREEQARIAGELDAARRIQAASLPRAELLMDDPRIDLSAIMISAREVGGDLYDFFRLDRSCLFFLVGDVAGKGLSASIFMAVSKALYKSTTLRNAGADLGAIMSAANAEVSRDNPEMLFVTAFAGVLDLDTGELSYCNAGHENPRLVDRHGAVGRLADGGGPPLCAVDGYAYREARSTIATGNLLCIVSDGVTEACNAAGELYGSERLQQVVVDAGRRGDDAASAVDAVRRDVEAFVAGAEPADDLTVFVLRWTGPAASHPEDRSEDAA